MYPFLEKYITAGELARLASTTKRTILFYDEKGVLKPAKINSKKYRFYLEKQILEYQMILLLTTLDISLTEIKQNLKRGNLAELFNRKKNFIEKEIKLLQFNLNNLKKYLTNMRHNGSMVNPQIETFKPFGVYYIEKTGPYSKISQYCQDLSNMFSNKTSLLTTLAIFENPTYQPKHSQIKIGVLADRKLKIKRPFGNLVKFMKFSPGKVISYTHQGSGSLLSLFWKELEKYCQLHSLKIRHGVPDFEIYRKVNENDLTKQFFEIYLPIE